MQEKKIKNLIEKPIYQHIPFGRKRSTSLAATTLYKMGVRISIILTLAALISYYHISSTLNTQIQDSLTNYINERGQRESLVFQRAEHNHKEFSRAFLQAWSERRNEMVRPEFERLFTQRDDGTLRLHMDAFTGINRADNTVSAHISGYVGTQAPASDEFKNKLLLSYELIDRYADGWTQDFANLYVSMPENVNLVYWPGLPWGDQAEASLDVNLEEWAYVANRENNSERESVWTGLYYDQTADEWMVSLVTPVDDSDGEHAINIGHDILLNTLFERVFNDKLEGTYNFIVRSDGRVIAHPSLLEELQVHQGLLRTEDIDNTELRQNIEFVISQQQRFSDSSAILEHDNIDGLLAATRIKGPDWIFVTYYPKSLNATIALQVASIVTIVGLVSLILELLILAYILRSQVLSPLSAFLNFSKEFISKDVTATQVLRDDPVHSRSDEMGTLSLAMVTMADTIIQHENHLEDMVTQRTQELNQANLNLNKQSRERQELFSLLKTIALDVSGLQGTNYYNTMNLFLAETLNADFVLLCEISKDKKMISSISATQNKQLIDNLAYPTADTPCEIVINEGTQVYNGNVQAMFPKDQDLVDLNLNSYIGTPLKSGNGDPIGHIAVMRHGSFEDPDKVKLIVDSITARTASEMIRQKNEEAILKQTQTDVLTGLPNRTLFMDRLSQAINHAKRSGVKLAVIFVDLDNFKLVNDRLGHAAGDRVLIESANRIKNLIRSQDTVARLGGDEFIVLLNDTKDAEGAESVARKILEAFTMDIDVGDASIRVSCSLGISIFPDDGDSHDTLISHADTAMYRAKELGRNIFQFYSKSIHKELEKQKHIEHDLRTAIGNQELELYYQPIFNIAEGGYTRAEGLIRWNHPDKGVIMPDQFIPVAEKTGQIIAISDQVLQLACRNFETLKDCWPELKSVSINCSVRQFHDQMFASNVTKTVERYGLHPSCINIEITESLFIDQNAKVVIDNLHELKERGFSISLDDFGTGYSSLSYLIKLPIDILKIDRSFVSELCTDNSAHTVVKSIIDIAHDFGQIVIAEGVETDAQASVLKTLECDCIQGYLYSKPVCLKSLLDNSLAFSSQ